MRKLVLAALLIGGLSQATGCFIESDDDDDDDDDDVVEGYIDVSWNLTAGREDENAALCPDGVDKARVLSVPTSGPEIPDTFNCEDGGGTTFGLPPDTYTVYVNFENEDETVLFAQSFSQEVVVTDGNTSEATFDVAVDGGYFGLTWSFDGTRANQDTCDALGAGGVGVLATLAGTADATDDLFDCAPGEGVTLKIPTGDHVVEVSLLDMEDPPGSLGSSDERTATIEYGNDFEDLGNFDFVTE